MYTEYINRLFETIKKTQFIMSDSLDDLGYEKGIEALVDAIIKIKENEKQLFFIGNGGSSAIASHMTADFMKNGGMKTYCLYDNAVTTCMGNDYGYEYVFSRPLSLLANKGDMLVAISSSGNSKNIINAIKAVQEAEASVITFSGFRPDNKMKGMGNINVYAPLEEYGIVESIHNLILQQIVDIILERDGVTL